MASVGRQTVQKSELSTNLDQNEKLAVPVLSNMGGGFLTPGSVSHCSFNGARAANTSYFASVKVRRCQRYPSEKEFHADHGADPRQPSFVDLIAMRSRYQHKSWGARWTKLETVSLPRPP